MYCLHIRLTLEGLFAHSAEDVVKSRSPWSITETAVVVNLRAATCLFCDVISLYWKDFISPIACVPNSLGRNDF
jgi:hypothetical protein